MNPSIVPSDVTIARVSGPDATILAGNQDAQDNVYGYGNPVKNNWDFEFDFQTSAGPGRLDGTDVSVFTLSLAGLTANDFNFANQGHYIAAHFQGIPGREDSGAAGDNNNNKVPDGGATVLLLGVALTGLAGIARHFKK